MEEKKMTFYPRNQKNIISFPKAKNKEALDQDEKITTAVLNIEKNMTEDSWDVQHCPDYILNILAQFGEVIDLKPIVARRLVANLATELVKRRLEATDPFGDLI